VSFQRPMIWIQKIFIKVPKDLSFSPKNIILKEVIVARTVVSIVRTDLIKNLEELILQKKAN